jgi:hypothetical protein
MLRDMWHFHQFSDEGSDMALACFNRAIELDDWSDPSSAQGGNVPESPT